jgi:GNAT superfamily N-acetyltransferase
MSYSQSNIEALFRLIGSLPNQEYVETENYHYIKTADNAWPNQLFNLTASDEKLDSVLDAIEIQVEKGLIPNLMMCDALEENELEIISRRNYTSSQWTAMSFDLVKRSFPSSKSTCSVLVVSSESELKEWLRIVESELMNDMKLNPAIFGELLLLEDCQFLMAYNDKQPVSTALLFHAGNAAGIYLVATLKPFRGRGIGTDITAACLQKAKNLHCDFAHLQATELGEPVYRSLGFKKNGVINVFRIKR